MQPICKLMCFVGFVLAFLFFSCDVAAAPDFDALEKSVVRIVTQTNQGIGTGTGFVINDQGYIATNVHVIAGANLIKAIPTNSNALYDVDVIALSHELIWQLYAHRGSIFRQLCFRSRHRKKGRRCGLLVTQAEPIETDLPMIQLYRMALLVEFFQVHGRYKNSGLFNTTRLRTPVIAAVLYWTTVEG